MVVVVVFIIIVVVVAFVDVIVVTVLKLFSILHFLTFYCPGKGKRHHYRFSRAEQQIVHHRISVFHESFVCSHIAGKVCTLLVWQQRCTVQQFQARVEGW